MIQRYAGRILGRYVVPYTTALDNSFLLMDGNTTSHTARLVENMIETKTIKCTEGPAYSSDLYAIEHVRYSL